MTQIIAFAGKKQSGKSSSGLYVLGHVLDHLNLLKKDEDGCAFGMSEKDGKLQLFAQTNASEEPVWTEYQHNDTSQWSQEMVWPFVRMYHLGDTLKNVMIEVFGLDPELCYGSDDDKNTETNITWQDVRFLLPPRQVSQLKADNMLGEGLTIRQALQYFGTDVCRRIQNDCWVKSCIRKIKEDAPKIALICDCRFPDEVQSLKEAGAKVIKIRRPKLESVSDMHSSEVALDRMKDEEFDAVINNGPNKTLQDKNYEILDLLYKWEVLPLVKVKNNV